MRIYFPDTPDLPLPAGHTFPAAKYRLLRERLAAEGASWRAALHPAPLARRDDLLLAHDADYVDAVLSGTLAREAQRRIGIPWSEILVARSRATIGGALAAADAALADGFSGQLAGGTHHAHRSFGSGYCVWNDCAVVSLKLLGAQRVARIAILDLDVHQGDGNAALLAPDPRVFVASVHGAKNFPFLKPPSDLDIALPDRTGDAGYLSASADALDAVMGFRPGLVLYISGVDPLAEDRLGKLEVSMAGLAARDRMVFDRCRAAGIPVAVAIGGGYAEPIRLTVDAYAQTFQIAAEVYGG